MNRKLQVTLHIIADLISASAAWLLFFLYRKHIVEAVKHGYDIPVNNDLKLYAGLIIIPLMWLLVYAGSGYYKNIFRRSRLREVERTFISGIAGSLVIFFLLILDDSVGNYKDYYKSLFVYFSLHTGITLLLRLLVVSRTIFMIQHRKWGYKTLLVGNGSNAEKLFRELSGAKKSEGFFIEGFIAGKNDQNKTIGNLRCLGNREQISQVIKKYEIEDVIICLDDEEHDWVPGLVDQIQNEKVHLKILPDSYGMVLGMVKMNNILGAMLVEVDFEVMPQWQKTAKRIFDILISLIALIVGLPVFILIGLAIKLDSTGTVFFRQERIGFKGRAFQIFKFRSMKNDAESLGPQLSSEKDPRRTKVGAFLRKSRLDELPQFINVLKGDMSIVGPRPERQYFIDQIVKKAPYYVRLHRIKPGITSWGQVKFGYAENVDEMVERMKYDILYLENMSLGLDIKIMIYTALIMIQGRGK
jgi:exopolysaccharide biosynthesis polyprenyl glycosylphosphotransferase